MPFLVITGRFLPKYGTPDGDSVRFVPDNVDTLFMLEGRPAQPSNVNGSVQLRLEGIDAIEKAAKPALSSLARDNLLKHIGFNGAVDEPRGYILSRMTDDDSARPIAFAYAGDPAEADGDEVFLDDARLDESVNAKQVMDGWAYPLYYNTLFASLRNRFNLHLETSRGANKGYWPTDATMTGVTVNGPGDLATIAPIWPKLWRRLEAFHAQSDFLDFAEFLEAKNERVDLLDIGEERGLQDVVEVQGNKVRMKVAPERLRVVGQAGWR